MEHNSVSPVHPELKGAQHRFLKAFASQCGVKVERLELPLLYYSLPIWTASMAAVKDGPSFCANMQVKEIPKYRKSPTFDHLLNFPSVFWKIVFSSYRYPTFCCSPKMGECV
jgi:hypothetical protein